MPCSEEIVANDGRGVEQLLVDFRRQVAHASSHRVGSESRSSGVGSKSSCKKTSAASSVPSVSKSFIVKDQIKRAKTGSP